MLKFLIYLFLVIGYNYWMALIYKVLNSRGFSNPCSTFGCSTSYCRQFRIGICRPTFRNGALKKLNTQKLNTGC